MQIVIDIDEDTYKDIKRGKIYTSVRDVPQESVLAIANGTPLPTDAVDRVTIKEYLDSFGKDTNVTATDCVKREDVENAIYDYSRSCDVNYEQIIEYIDKLPSVTPQPMSGYISIADAMSAFDDFMCNDIEPEGQEVFLELLKDRAERSKE